MIYYTIKDNFYLKYEVLFDKDKLRKLQKECVLKSGRKIHKKIKSNKFNNDEFTQEIKTTNIGYIEDFYGDIPLYEKESIEYIKPTLYYIIEDILNDKISGLIDLYKMDMSKEYSYEKDIEERIKSISKIGDNDIDRKLREYNALSKIIKEKEYNIDQLPIIEYYKKVIDLITIKLVNSITISKIKIVENFLGYSLNICENEELNNVMRRVYKNE